MLVLLTSAAALAADLQFSFVTDDGVAESASWPTFEAYTRRFGPQQAGKSSVVYTVTVPSSVYDAVRGGFVVDVSVCLEWSRKGEYGRYCDPIQLLAKDPGQPSRYTQSFRGKDKFTYTVEVAWTGEPPAAAAQPQPPAAPAEPTEG